MQYKASRFELKAAGDNTIEGYAAYFGNVDSYGDIIEQGAFTKTLKENSARVKVLWQHDTSEPIGKPIAMEQDSKRVIYQSQNKHDRYRAQSDGVNARWCHRRNEYWI